MALHNPFSSIQLNIRSTFDDLIQKLTARRNQLLDELEKLENNYKSNEETRKQTIMFIEAMIEQAKKIPDLTEGTAGVLLEDNKSHLEKLKQPTPFPVPQFDNSRLQELEELIYSFGGVQDATVPYINKIKPIKCIGKKGKGKLELDGPRGIATDGKGNLYIADGRNRRIQVFGLDGTYVTEFGNEELASPHSVAICDQCVIVTDRIHHSVIKYRTCDFEIASRCDNIFKLPLGLCIDGDEVFVADSKHDRVAVLDLELVFIREFGRKTQTTEAKLIQPVDVKTNIDNVFVVDNGEKNHIHIFSKSGYENTTIIKLNPDIGSIFLCIDTYNNIIVSDYLSDVIKIFTPAGELLQKIDTDYKPTGVVVTESNKILCADFSKNCINWY